MLAATSPSPIDSLAAVRRVARAKFSIQIPSDVCATINQLMTALRIPSAMPNSIHYTSSELSVHTHTGGAGGGRGGAMDGVRVQYKGPQALSSSGNEMGLGLGLGLGRRNRNRESTADEWDALRPDTIRTFQPTAAIATATGYQAIIDRVRAQWNKTTSKTYLDSREKIFELLRSSTTIDATPADIHNMATMLYDIASNNLFYSNLYAELYAAILGDFESLRAPLENVLANYAEMLYSNFVYHSNDDYDSFCAMTKLNDRRRAQTCFLKNMCAVGYITPDVYTRILHYLVQFIMDNRSMLAQKAAVDEMTENLILLFDATLLIDPRASASEYLISTESGRITILNALELVSVSSAKEYAGLSNKTIFHYKDLMDAYKKTQRK